MLAVARRRMATGRGRGGYQHRRRRRRCGTAVPCPPQCAGGRLRRGTAPPSARLGRPPLSEPGPCAGRRDLPRMPLIWEVACRLGMASVLDAGAADLGRLSDAEAVELFAGLLWADSAARGIRAEIDVPRSIDARDGGIDATVRAPAGTAGQGVIGPGVTRYRIKSGRGFNPSSKEARRRLLFRPGGRWRAAPAHQRVP